MDYPSSLVPAFFGYSTRLLRRCLLDSPIFESGVIRAILPRDAERTSVDRRVTRVRSLLIWRRSGILKNYRVERLASISVPSISVRLASRDFNFAAARSSLAFLLLIATTARPSRVLLLCVPFRHDTVTRSAAWFFFLRRRKTVPRDRFLLCFYAYGTSEASWITINSPSALPALPSAALFLRVFLSLSHVLSLSLQSCS